MLTDTDRAELLAARDRGVVLLDENKPEWHRYMSPWRGFDMQSCQHCVLGHVFGDFGVGVNSLQAGEYDSAWTAEHGFDVPRQFHNREHDRIEAYLFLSQAWASVIIQRQAAELRKLRGED